MVNAMWVGGFPLMPGARFRVRSLAKAGFSKEIARRGDRIPHSERAALGRARLVAALHEIAADVTLDLILEGWSGVTVGGVSVPFEREQARAAMLAQAELLPTILSAAARVDDASLPGYTAVGMA